MGFFNVPRAPFIQIDADTIRLEDLLDVDLSHYFDITLDDVNNYVLFNPKIGDLRIQDPDDDDDSDYIQFTTDDTLGGFIQLSSRITAGNIWEIDHNGTIIAANIINGFNYDADGMEINDNAGAEVIVLRAAHFELSSVTATDVGTSSLIGLSIEMPAMHTIYGGVGAGAMYITENTDDAIFEMMNSSGNVIAIAGDTFNTGRTWMVISPSAATLSADVNNILLDLAITSLTIDDGGNTPEIRMLRLDADSVVCTTVGNTDLTCIEINQPTTGNFNVEDGLAIRSQKTEDNYAGNIYTLREITGEIAVDATMEYFAVTHNQYVQRSVGDFVVQQATGTGGVLQLNLIHLVELATTNPDEFWSTALDINVRATANVGTFDARIDVGARALNIDYLIAETNGIITLDDDIDIARIVLRSTGTDWECDADVDWDMLELNGNGFIMNDATFTLRGLHLDFLTITDTSFEAFYGQLIEMPAAYAANPTAALRATGNSMVAEIITRGDYGLYIDSELAGCQAIYIDISMPVNTTNNMMGLYIVKDASLTVDADANINLQQPVVQLTSTATNDDDFGYDIDHSVVVIDIDLVHYASATAVPIADTFSGMGMHIDIIADMDNNANNVLTTTARGIDILYDINYDTAGTHTLGATDVIKVDFDVAASVTIGGNFNIINLDGTGFDPGAGAWGAGYTINGLKIDWSGTTYPADLNTTLYGIEIIMPAAYQALSVEAAIHATGNGNVFDALLGDGILLTMGEVASIGLNVVSSENDAANAKQTITTNRNLVGILTVDRAVSAYSVVHTVSNDNNATDNIDLTFATGGVMEINMYQECSCNDVGKPAGDPDTFVGTALRIDVNSVSNVANAHLDTSARALDITYSVLNTAAGVNDILDTDIARIQVDGWTPTTVTGAHIFNMLMLDTIAITIDDANTTFRGLQIDFDSITDTNVVLEAITMILPETAYGIHIIADAAHAECSDDHIAGDIIYAEIGVNSADLNFIHAEIDIGTLLSAGEIVKGIFLDINEAVVNADTSGIYGFDAIITGFATSRNDVIGYRAYLDGSYTGADDISGFVVDPTTGTMVLDTATFRGLYINGTGYTHTAGNFYGLDIALNGSTVTAGVQRAINITTGVNTDQAIFINANSSDLATDASLIDIDMGIAANVSADAIKIAMEFSGAMAGTDDSKGIYVVITEGATHLNGASLMGVDIAITGLTASAADIVGMNIKLDGTSDQGDTTKGIFIDLDSTISNASEYLYGIQLDMDGIINTSCAAAVNGITGCVGMYINADKSASIANPNQTLATSRDFAGVTTVDIAMTNYSVVHSIVNTNTPTGDFDFNFDVGAGVMNLIMQQTNASTADKTDPDKFNATCLSIDVGATTSGDLNAELDVAARALDIAYTLTETLGELRMAATDVARITATIPDGLSSAAAFDFSILKLEGDNVVLNDANITFSALLLDGAGLTNTLSAKASMISITNPSGRMPAIDANQRGLNSGRIEWGAYYFEDDFDNRADKPEWVLRVTTGSTGGAGVSTDLNGVNQLLTGGAAADEESLDWDDIFTFQNTLRPTFEVRVYLELVDDDTNYAFGLVNSNIGNGQAGLALNQGAPNNQDFIIIEMSHTTHTNTNWHLSSQCDGVSTVEDGAAAVATTWTVLRFEFISDTSVEWFIDGVSQGIITDNVPTDPLQPILFVLTDNAATKYVDVDYVKIWADRS